MSLMSTVVIINMVLCAILSIIWMPHTHILLVPTTLSYSAKDYHRPSSYAYCFYQVSQRGTSMPPVQRTYGDCFISTIGHPYREDKENRFMDSSYNALSNSTTIILMRDFEDFCPCWNVHHVSFLCAWLQLAAQCSSLTSMHTSI